jgi:glutathione peroxidase
VALTTAPATPAPAVVQGPVAAASDPANLPPAGTAPAPVAVDKTFDELWTASIHTSRASRPRLRRVQGQGAHAVNVASKCGNTPQYATLEALQRKYESKGFTIGFPCNQFHGQEPGTAEEIATFCATNYGIIVPDHGEDRGQRRQPPSDLQGAHPDRRRRRPQR